MPTAFNGLTMRFGKYVAKGAGVRTSSSAGGEVLGVGANTQWTGSDFELMDEASKRWKVRCNASWDSIKLFTVDIPRNDTGHKRFACSFSQGDTVRGQLAFAAAGFKVQLDDQS